MLEGRELSLHIGPRAILEGVSLELHPGRITALIGPNGSGKSCLLRLLTGEWIPSSGNVYLDGRRLATYPAPVLAKRRACLPQESSLDFAFTVMEVVLLGRSPHAASGETPQDREWAAAALRGVDMEASRDRLYTRLSGGEKRRVQLARVLAQVLSAFPGEPAYLFLDEPMNALDLAHQIQALQLIRERAAHHTAIAVVLHDLNQAFQLADEILLLRDGHLVAKGPPAEVIESPALDAAMGTRLRRMQWDAGKLPWLIPDRQDEGRASPGETTPRPY